MDSISCSRLDPETGAETVYGTHEDGTMVMSEKVQALAGSIYQEFERMMQRYDEDVVKTLMPLLVNVLECLDTAYRTNQEQEVELELLREDNEQLVTQYEREKSARKQSEQKLLETEDLAEAENKDLASRLESLESIVRMLELKHKNSLEHASRLEERESELKKEYSKLHERYTELFKTHVDYMERTKMLMGSSHSQISSASERLDINRARSSGAASYGFASLDNSVMLDTETICSIGNSSDGSGPPSLQNEIESMEAIERASEIGTLHQTHPAISPELGTHFPVRTSQQPGKSTTKKEQRSGNTLYQELSFQDNEEGDENEVTGSWVHPGDYASTANDNFYGMGKEVENLIMENNELMATKNALNIVKDDLIVRVDELTGEIEILREELNAMSQSRNKLRQKVTELEDELKKTREQVKQQNDSEQESDAFIPMAQRKRFTRVEMAMVLMERNQYKERLMELQEAVRLTDILRASRTVELDKKSKLGIWKYFSNLFSNSNRPQRKPTGSMVRYTSPTRYEVASENRLLASHGNIDNAEIGLANSLVFSKDYSDEVSSERVNSRRREQYRQLRAHVQKEDGRMSAYGWSLPSNKIVDDQLPKHTGGVPVLVHCNTLTTINPNMKVFCAAGVNLNGGCRKDGSYITGNDVFWTKQCATVMEIIPTSKECGEEESSKAQLPNTIENKSFNEDMGSHVWICSSTHCASTVTVIDANVPGTVLDTFSVCQTHILCIASVAGAVETEYAVLENSEIVRAGEMLEKPGVGPFEIGKVEFCRRKEKAGPKDDTNENKTIASASTSKSESDLKIEAIAIENESIPPNELNEFRPPESQNDNSSSLDGVTDSNRNKIKCAKSSNLEGKSQPGDFSSTLIDPTMWIGAQNGLLYVHSSISRWSECLEKIVLPDPALGIINVGSRVVVALANGKLAVFRRKTDGNWDLNSYHLVTLGETKHSVRCLCVVSDKIWAAHRNKIFIIDPISLDILHTLEAHPRKESQVRQMAATGLGVWVSIRLDSTLRLYHAHTYEHIQDIDIEPYVSKMLGTGKLGFSFVRITALMVSCSRLWIGTSNGVVISVPLTNCSQNNVPSSVLIPRCGMANAQLSFHGHRDAVKFFVSVPMHQSAEDTKHFKSKSDMIVMCGGDGYIDFRQGDNDMEKSAHLEPNETTDKRGDKSYLIVWHVSET